MAKWRVVVGAAMKIVTTMMRVMLINMAVLNAWKTRNNKGRYGEVWGSIYYFIISFYFSLKSQSY